MKPITVIPVVKQVVSSGHAPGLIDIADATHWHINKSLIHALHFRTASDNYNVWLVQNDDGVAADTARIPPYQVVVNGNGNVDAFLSRPYVDEDETREVHFEYEDLDVTGPHNIEIEIEGEDRQ